MPSDFYTQANSEYIDQLFALYQKDPGSVPAEWRAFFAGFDLALGKGATLVGAAGESNTVTIGTFDLVHTYRELGHCEANLDPLDAVRPAQPLLALSEFGMSDADMDRVVGNGSFMGSTDGTLRDLLGKLRTTYCGSIGVEFIGIHDKTQRDWLTEQMEPRLNQPNLTKEEQLSILFQLTAAEEFENYLHTRFVGKKRFSLEGAESLIPMVNTIIDEGHPIGVENFVLGMAHRGRLNVLAHVLNKPYEAILAEFEGTYATDVEGDGDVKYHLGYSCLRPEKQGTSVKISLQPNPSHLELVNPVVEGIVRAKQTYLGDTERTRVVPVLIHGDAAFVGQGVVHETLNLSELVGFRTGGTVHLLVNNQIGFTTSPKQGRFTPYPTDVAKNIQAPIFHVNGDDPEAVVYIAKLAIAFRERFKMDAIIDMWCYRRYGHNETDAPEFTQPKMYDVINSKLTTRGLYAKKLIEAGVITGEADAQMRAEVVGRLEKAHKLAKETRPKTRLPSYGGVWTGLSKGPTFGEAEWHAKTSVNPETLRAVADAYAKVPSGFTPNAKVQRLYQQSRRDAVQTGKGIDWGNGEMLGLGSLMLEGFDVRFTGQDVERGTFGHRHAVLHDAKTDETLTPLNALPAVGGKKPGQLTIINSMLSEVAVLGFEWGYAAAEPRSLVVWEAQFGDFVNGAQPIIDQFLTSAESKWQQSNGLVLMLPHGYEGAGPEHSNAYMERFLSLCAEDNIQVVVPTTPAQVFHALRRQMHRKFRKPLVLFQPKSLLRLPQTFSRIEDLADAGFEYVIDDTGVADRSKVSRVLLCTGKVYYSLAAARDKTSQSNVAIVRIEQLYPLPAKSIQQALAKYPNVKDVAWVQEEPANRGAYGYIDRKIRGLLPNGITLGYFGREEAASPAVGSEKVHSHEEQELLSAALSVPARTPEVKQTAKAEPATARGGAVSD